MRFLERYYPEARFGGFSDLDGTIIFYSRVNALLRPEFTVLDFGCGPGTYQRDEIEYRRRLRILKGKVTQVIGLDIDPEASNNPYIDTFRLASTRWDLPDDCADLCLADNVIEHLDEPAAFFEECRRVLKPGGYLCIRTPNALSYFGLAMKFIPYHRRARLIRHMSQKAERDDPYPTYYRLNTVRKIRDIMAQYQFDSVVYGYEAEPSYHDFSRIVYLLGYLHQKICPGRFKLGVFAFGRLEKELRG